MTGNSSSGTEQYVIVNTRTELVEAGPYAAHKAQDKLTETREKLRNQTEDAHVYVPTDLKLRRYVQPGSERQRGER